MKGRQEVALSGIWEEGERSGVGHYGVGRRGIVRDLIQYRLAHLAHMT